MGESGPGQGDGDARADGVEGEGGGGAGQQSVCARCRYQDTDFQGRAPSLPAEVGRGEQGSPARDPWRLGCRGGVARPVGGACRARPLALCPLSTLVWVWRHGSQRLTPSSGASDGAPDRSRPNSRTRPYQAPGWHPRISAFLGGEVRRVPETPGLHWYTGINRVPEIDGYVTSGVWP